MALNHFLGLLTASFFLAPFLLILATGMFANKSIASLGLYCFFSAVYHTLNANLVPVSTAVRTAAAAMINYLDAPLMLGVLLLYCHTQAQRKRLLTIGVLYVAYEIAVGLRFGLQRISTVYTSGAGLLLIFLLGIYFFVMQLKQTIRFGKGMGRTLIAAAVFFTYGLYALIYVLYYLQEIPQVDEVYLLYYLATLFFCVLITAALVQLYGQHRKIRQLLQVRRELAAFFQT